MKLTEIEFTKGTGDEKYSITFIYGFFPEKKGYTCFLSESINYFQGLYPGVEMVIK